MNEFLRHEAKRVSVAVASSAATSPGSVLIGFLNVTFVLPVRNPIYKTSDVCSSKWRLCVSKHTSTKETFWTMRSLHVIIALCSATGRGLDCDGHEQD